MTPSRNVVPRFSIAPAAEPVLGCVADDITGATDLASALMGAGVRTTLVLGVPGVGTSVSIGGGAVVVALKSRNLPPEEAVAETLTAVEWLKGLGAGRLFIKYCSTFDSTSTGNIGPVTDAVMAHLGTSLVVHAPTYPANGRTVYQGHLFVGTALLSESGMQHHPLTPMTDPNLLRVLSAQTDAEVMLLPWSVVSAGAERVRGQLRDIAHGSRVHVIADALTDGDLRNLAKGAESLDLVAGGAAFGAAWGGLLAGELRPAPAPRATSGAGRGVVLVGSASETTRKQVAAFESHHPVRRLSLDELQDPEALAVAVASWVLEHPADEPLLVSAETSPDGVSRARERYGPQDAADRIEQSLALIAVALVEAGVRRLVVAGGETSGAVALALRLGVLEVGPDICAGVPWTFSTDPDVDIAFKSGNFGGDDLFLHALNPLLLPTTGTPMSDERRARDDIVALGQALYDRGVTPGRTGNLSIRLGDHVLVTPTGVSLGRLDRDALSLIELDGTLVSGAPPTKEAALHLALYAGFPDVGAVAHGHTTHAVAWSCLRDLQPFDCLPALTAYYAMRVGELPLIEYAPPGDPRLAEDLSRLRARCALLANHGSISSGATLETAVDALEEIEETARIALLLRGTPTRSLTSEERTSLR